MSYWHPVAHESEVANDGDYVLLPWSANGEVVVSNFGGEVVAWNNRCPHRGARIYTQTRGNRPPVCGYHGRCAKANQVTRFETRNSWGLIFVADGSVTRIPMIGDAPHLPRKPHTAWGMVMDCHWSVAIENALDLEHVSTVHEGSLSALKLTRAALERYTDGSTQEIFDSGIAERLDRLCELAGVDSLAADYVHMHMFPFSCLASTRGLTVSLQHYFPRADGKTIFYHRMYVPTETKRDMGVYYRAVAEMNRRVFEEDAAICALVPPDHDGPLEPHEDRISHFRQYSRWMA